MSCLRGPAASGQFLISAPFRSSAPVSVASSTPMVRSVRDCSTSFALLPRIPLPNLDASITRPRKIVEPRISRSQNGRNGRGKTVLSSLENRDCYSSWAPRRAARISRGREEGRAGRLGLSLEPAPLIGFGISRKSGKWRDSKHLNSDFHNENEKLSQNNFFLLTF